MDQNNREITEIISSMLQRVSILKNSQGQHDTVRLGVSVYQYNRRFIQAPNMRFNRWPFRFLLICLRNTYWLSLDTHLCASSPHTPRYWQTSLTPSSGQSTSQSKAWWAAALYIRRTFFFLGSKYKTWGIANLQSNGFFTSFRKTQIRVYVPRVPSASPNCVTQVCWLWGSWVDGWLTMKYEMDYCLDCPESLLVVHHIIYY